MVSNKIKLQDLFDLVSYCRVCKYQKLRSNSKILRHHNNFQILLVHHQIIRYGIFFAYFSNKFCFQQKPIENCSLVWITRKKNLTKKNIFVKLDFPTRSDPQQLNHENDITTHHNSGKRHLDDMYIELRADIRDLPFDCTKNHLLDKNSLIRVCMQILQIRYENTTNRDKKQYNNKRTQFSYLR